MLFLFSSLPCFWDTIFGLLKSKISLTCCPLLHEECFLVATGCCRSLSLGFYGGASLCSDISPCFIKKPTWTIPVWHEKREVCLVFLLGCWARPGAVLRKSGSLLAALLQCWGTSWGQRGLSQSEHPWMLHVCLPSHPPCSGTTSFKALPFVSCLILGFICVCVCGLDSFVTVLCLHSAAQPSAPSSSWPVTKLCWVCAVNTAFVKVKYLMLSRFPTCRTLVVLLMPVGKPLLPKHFLIFFKGSISAL